MQTLLKKTQAYHILKTECAKNQNAHAYLLIFNDAQNLSSALKTFAKLFFHCDELNDAKSQRISQLIDNDSFSDCLCFFTDNKKLAVEDAERIQEESALNAVEGEKKVFLIGDFAEANAQTQNKLLKLLEEPPKDVVFLLGSTTAFPVLSTVISRTKKLEIPPFDILDVAECLFRTYKDKYPRDTYTLCAATSDGNVGQAQNILEGGFYTALMDNAFSLALTTNAKLPVLIKQIGETKHQKQLLALLRIIFRDALLLKMRTMQAVDTSSYVKKMQNPDGKPVDSQLLLRLEKQKLLNVAKKYTFSALLYAQEALSNAEFQIKFNAVFSQCLEICIANILKNNEK